MTQRSEAGEARTRVPSISKQALYHYATMPPVHRPMFLWSFISAFAAYIHKV